MLLFMQTYIKIKPVRFNKREKGVFYRAMGFIGFIGLLGLKWVWGLRVFTFETNYGKQCRSHP